MKQNMLYWSPGVDFEACGEQLRVGALRFSFGGEFFPEYYYIVRRGTDKESLIQHFGRDRKAAALTRELVSAGVLTEGIPDLNMMFYGLHHYTDRLTDEDLAVDIEKQDLFRKSAAARNANTKESIMDISLEEAGLPDYAKNHVSTRIFEEKQQIDFNTFSAFLRVLGENRERAPGRFYPSAGGLYPIDLFLYVKRNRVERLPGGIYYFYPAANSVSCIEQCEIPQDVHYVTNRDIFRSSAFSLFMVYNGRANMPKYGYKGYAYGLLDCGIMTELIHIHCSQLALGCCSIGDMDFGRLGKQLMLPADSTVVHAVEVGRKPEPARKKITEVHV